VVKGAPTKKAKLHITSPGRFLYEMNKDRDVATFHVQPAGPVVPSRTVTPRVVKVVRTNPDITNSEDVIQCHQLTLHLRRKDAGAAKTSPVKQDKPVKPAGSEDQLEGTEIESIHAIADLSRPSSEVSLQSPS